MTVKVPEKSKVVVGTHFASIDKEVKKRKKNRQRGRRETHRHFGKHRWTWGSRGQVFFTMQSIPAWKPNDLGRFPRSTA